MKEALDYFKGDKLAASTYLKKYALKDKEGNIIESSPDQMHKRLAKEIARIESKYEVTIEDLVNKEFSNSYYNYPLLREDTVYDLLKDFKYIILGGSVMAGLGSNMPVSLSNCFVIDSPEDSYSSIMNSRNEQVQLMKRRGGWGKDLSKLRPRGAKVNNAALTSTGAASFMEVESEITNEVAQEGRRGAAMLSIHINHPDVEEFFTKKQDLTKVTGANISVQVTDEFMNAVLNDEDYLLRFPTDLDVSKGNYYSNHEHLLEYNKLYNNSVLGYIKKVRAKELWNKLITCAYNTAEPGILFIDHIHNAPDGVYEEFKAISTNPCGIVA